MRAGNRAGAEVVTKASKVIQPLLLSNFLRRLFNSNYFSLFAQSVSWISTQQNITFHVSVHPKKIFVYKLFTDFLCVGCSLTTCILRVRAAPRGTALINHRLSLIRASQKIEPYEIHTKFLCDRLFLGDLYSLCAPSALWISTYKINRHSLIRASLKMQPREFQTKYLCGRLFIGDLYSSVCAQRLVDQHL